MLPKSRQAPCGPHLHGMHNPPSQDTHSGKACSAPACWVAGAVVSSILYLLNTFQGFTAVASSVLGMNVTLSLLSLHMYVIWKRKL